MREKNIRYYYYHSIKRQNLLGIPSMWWTISVKIGDGEKMTRHKTNEGFFVRKIWIQNIIMTMMTFHYLSSLFLLTINIFFFFFIEQKCYVRHNVACQFVFLCVTYLECVKNVWIVLFFLFSKIKRANEAKLSFKTKEFCLTSRW